MESEAAQREAAQREQELTYENALLLLGEFEEVLDELEEAEEPTEEQQEHARDLMERLLSSLDDIPFSSEMARERLANVESWSRVLVTEEDDEAGPGSIGTLLRDELAELRGLLEYEMTT